MSFIDQSIADFYAAPRSSSLSSKILGALAIKSRNLRLLLGDPIVKFRWCGETIGLPLSHDLPRYSSAFPDYNVSLGRLTAVVADYLHRPVVAIDVGANIGDTAILLLKYGAGTVICVEGSPRYAALLKQNTKALPQVFATECLVAFTDAPENMGISEARGTGFVVERAAQESSNIKTLSEILAFHGCDPRTVDLVKIDTDGYDGAIIRHHADFFADVKPLIYFEYLFCPVAKAAIESNLPDERSLQALSAIGYDRFIAYRNIGTPVAYGQVDQAATLLRELYSSGILGAYADVAVFPPTMTEIAERAAEDLGLVFISS